MKLKGTLLIWALLSPHRPSHSLLYGWSITSLKSPPRHAQSLVPKSLPSFSFSHFPSSLTEVKFQLQTLMATTDLETLWHKSFSTPGWCFSPSCPYSEDQRPQLVFLSSPHLPSFLGCSHQTDSVPDFLPEQSKTRAANFHTHLSLL